MKCEEWEQANYRARAKEKSSRYKDREQKLEPKSKAAERPRDQAPRKPRTRSQDV